MTPADLSVFFQPGGVAVIGASRDPQKLGHGVIRNLIEHRYAGPIYPINPGASDVLGLKAYSTIADVPDPLDLAVIVVPAQFVEAELEAAGKRGVKAAIIISGGFREIGPEGAAREESLKRIAAQHHMLLLGPNCIGTIDTHTPLNTTFVSGIPAEGQIAFISQSGAVAAAIIDWARGSGVGLSRIVSLGNQAGVTEAEMLAAIGQDGWTSVITLYMEGVSSGRGFIESAAQVARQMPVIALKVGRSAGGAQAVASHTGALAGDEAAYDAAFRRAGVLRARTLEEMLDWARALAWQALPSGRRVAILTNAGGPGVLALDALEEVGLQLAPLTEETREHLRKRVFPAASVNNPVDILAGAGPATYAVCLDALLADPTVDAVIVVQAPQDWFAPVSLAEVVGEIANGPQGGRKPILTAIMGLASTSEATQVLHRRHIPNFAFPERAGRTLGALWRRRQWLDAAHDQPEPAPLEMCDLVTARMVMEASDHISDLGESESVGAAGWMSPSEVEALFHAYCIATPRSGLAPNVDQARLLAESVGFPVVLKLAAQSVTHKTDVGGIVLNIRSPEQLVDSFDDMMASVKQRLPDLAVVEGITVQQMIRGQAELIAGVVRDPQFGPLVMVGAGGTGVELARDVTFELAPLTHKQVGETLDRTTAGALLAGYRGAPPADRDAVIDAILRLTQIALDWPQVQEIEINPLMAMPQGGGCFAVDSRVRLSRSVQTEDQESQR